MKYLEFDCGCKFPIIREGVNRPFINVNFDAEKHSFECKKAWDVIGRGDTKGVFQLESSLGQQLSARLKPTNIEQLSALTAIIRPGCRESIDSNGKSVTDRYIDRKNGNEPITYYHPSLEASLKKTFGELIYQEEAMQIARDVAGFSLQDADVLRKAIGKKKPEEMAKVKKMFLEGCEKMAILNNEQAAEIFNGIEKSQRYSFNKCLTSNTIVELYNREFKTIDELSIGEQIKAPKDNNNDEFVTVVNKYDNGKQEVFEITTESGKMINCTKNHEFLCEDGESRPLYQILLYEIKIMCEND